MPITSRTNSRSWGRCRTGRRPTGSGDVVPDRPTRGVSPDPAPWKVRSARAQNGFAARLTPDADPRWLYHAVLVVLDEARGINIGEPTLWARLLAHTRTSPRVHGCCKSARVSDTTPPSSPISSARKGWVAAYEVQGDLAERARANLLAWSCADVHHGNAITDLSALGDHDPFDLVVAFAGVTHVPRAWSAGLSENAPASAAADGRGCGWGAMILSRIGPTTASRPPPWGGAASTRAKAPATMGLAKRVSELFSDPSPSDRLEAADDPFRRGAFASNRGACETPDAGASPWGL